MRNRPFRIIVNDFGSGADFVNYAHTAGSRPTAAFTSSSYQTLIVDAATLNGALEEIVRNVGTRRIAILEFWGHSIRGDFSVGGGASPTKGNFAEALRTGKNWVVYTI